jgi:hypothetical protein
MSLYQVSTRASRRRRIGAWLRARWDRRVGSGRHHQTGDVSSRYAYAPKVVQHAFVPPAEPSSADLVDANVDALVKSQSTVKLSVPTVKQRPGSAAPGAAPAMARRPDAPGTATDADRPTTAEQPSINGTPKVPQQRPPSRTTSVYPNAYRAR